MKTKECPSCAMQVDANSKVCPICSYEFPDRRHLDWKLIALLLATLYLLYILFL